MQRPRWLHQVKPRWIVLAEQMTRGEVWTVLVVWAVVGLPLFVILPTAHDLNEYVGLGVGAIRLTVVLIVKARPERHHPQ
jgi:hypothetical protein